MYTAVITAGSETKTVTSKSSGGLDLPKVLDKMEKKTAKDKKGPGPGDFYEVARQMSERDDIEPGKSITFMSKSKKVKIAVNRK